MAEGDFQITFYHFTSTDEQSSKYADEDIFAKKPDTQI